LEHPYAAFPDQIFSQLDFRRRKHCHLLYPLQRHLQYRRYIGQRCPLTKLALRMGDPTGDDYIADFLFPQWFKPYVSPACGTLALIGFIILGLRLLTA
jgi:hypothetical protein